jgi:hypothetical protein
MANVDPILRVIQRIDFGEDQILAGNLARKRKPRLRDFRQPLKESAKDRRPATVCSVGIEEPSQDGCITKLDPIDAGNRPDINEVTEAV